MTNKDWLTLSIITFLTITIWTIFDVYHSAVSSTITQTQQELLEPLDPSLKTEIFDTIRSRRD